MSINDVQEQIISALGIHDIRLRGSNNAINTLRKIETAY